MALISAYGALPGQSNFGTFRTDFIPQSRQGSIGSLLCPELASPNHYHLPAFPLQSLSDSDVPLLICFDLRTPVVEPGFWKSTYRTFFVAMPETAVNKNRQFVATDRYVRPSWYVRIMHSISHTLGPQETTHKHFRACVLAMHRGHDLAAFFPTSCIHAIRFYGTPRKMYGEYLWKSAYCNSMMFQSLGCYCRSGNPEPV